MEPCFFDTVFREFNSGRDDTVWKEVTFLTHGEKNVTVTPYSSIALSAAIGRITVIKRPGPENTAPLITVLGDTIVAPGQICSLIVNASDSDSGQAVEVSMEGGPQGAELRGDSLFVWNVPEDLTGADTILFIAIDNGMPPLSDTDTVIITVSPGSENHAPEWSYDTLEVSINDTDSYTLSLFEACSDPDEDEPDWELLSGAPDGDTIIDGEYRFGASLESIGTHYVHIVAMDADSATDTLVIELSVERIPDIGFFLRSLLLSAGTLTEQSAPVPDTIFDTVSYMDSAITVTPVTFDTQCTIFVGEQSLHSGTTSDLLPLVVGTTAIVIEVISPDNDEERKTYTVLVVRKPNSTIPLTAPPSGVAAVAVSASSIRITWDDLFGANSYTVQRSDAEEGSFATIGTPTGNSYSDTGLEAGSTWYYRVSASNLNNSTDYSGAVHATTWVGPSITTPPEDVTVNVGETITLTVVASGNPACTYQWKKDGDELVGKTGSILKITSAKESDAGEYTVVATNSVRSIESEKAVVTVMPLCTLTVTASPASGGSVAKDKSDDVFPSGTEVTLTATSNADYRFDGWTGDTTVAKEVNPLIVIMRKNRMITAKWVRQYTLTLITSDAIKGTVSSTMGTSPLKVDSGMVVPISATPGGSFKFKQWAVTSGHASIAGPTSTSTSVTMAQGNATVQGGFGCITFKKVFDGGEVVAGIAQAIDGTYFLIVHRNHVIKLDKNGDKLWDNTYLDDEDALFQSIYETSNGLIITGNINTQAYLLGIAVNGNKLFSTSLDQYNAVPGFWAYFAKPTNDGGYILGGLTELGWAIKTNYDGDFEYKGATSGDPAYLFQDGQQTKDGGYIFVGKQMGGIITVNKFNNELGFVWSNTYGKNTGSSICQTANGRYIIGGDGDSKGYLTLIEESGEQVWQKEEPRVATIESVYETDEGDFIYAGETNYLGNGGYDLYIAKADSNGATLWIKTYGSTGDERNSGMKITKDGGFIVTSSNGWVVKTDENGVVD